MYIASAVIPPPLQSGLLVTSISTREGEIGVGCSSAVGTWRRKRGRQFLDNASAATLAFPSTYVAFNVYSPRAMKRKRHRIASLSLLLPPELTIATTAALLVPTLLPIHAPTGRTKVLLAAAP